MRSLLKRIQQTAEEGLYRPDSGGGGLSFEPPPVQIRYVASSGSDVTGTGSFSRPFATPAHAESVIIDATALKPYAIFISPGTFAGDIALKPFISLRGIDPSDRPELTGTLSLDASFTDNQSVSLDSCIFTHAQTIDFLAIANPELDIVDCAFTGVVTLRGTNATTFRLRRNRFGNDTRFTDASDFETVGNVFANSDGGCVVSATDESGSWFSDGDSFEGAVTVIAVNPNTLSVQFTGSQIGNGSSLTLNGAGVTFIGSAGAIPPTITLLGGASAPVLATKANGIGYAPTGAIGVVWAVSTPSSVANPSVAGDSALDRIAAAVAGLLAPGGIP
jgi:hypothetical protein